MMALRVIAALAALFGLGTWYLFVAFAHGFACGYHGGSNGDCGLALRDFFDHETGPITIAVVLVAGALLTFAFAPRRAAASPEEQDHDTDP